MNTPGTIRKENRENHTAFIVMMLVRNLNVVSLHADSRRLRLSSKYYNKGKQSTKLICYGFVLLIIES